MAKQDIWVLNVELLPSPLAQNKWKGKIEIDSQSTFVQLHSAIQEAIEFESDHMYQFTITSSNRAYGGQDSIAISSTFGGLADSNFEHDVATTTLEDIFPLPKDKNLIYWFDFGDDWMFKITKNKSGVKYPRLVSETGKKPIQYPDFG